jgi:hypothetical protein
VGDPGGKTHPAVQHPVRLRITRHRDGMGWVGKANDWAATHLAVVFGSVWTVWVFFAWPLLAQFLGSQVKSITSYYAQSWIQLFALALFVYIGNKLQRSSDAQSEVMHQALTHIASASDDVKAAMAVTLDRLEVTTEGGLKDLYDKLAARQDDLLAGLTTGVLTAPRETVTPTARARRTAGKKAP